MTRFHLEILVEEQSAEAFLDTVLARTFGTALSVRFLTFRGKRDLLGNLGPRLRAYARIPTFAGRVIVLVDRDRDDCRALKSTLEVAAGESGLPTRARSRGSSWFIATRIAVEELEAWYFGDWEAVCAAYPKVPATQIRKNGFRKPDEIGDTWEALERVLKSAGYFTTGLRKVQAARAIGAKFEPGRCQSPSFQQFWDAVREAATLLPP